MTVHNPPLFLQQRTDHTAQNDRSLITATFQRPGVLGIGDLVVVEQATPTMGVTVGAGMCVVEGTDVANQGFYLVWNDAPLDLVVSAADPTNDRIDLIVVRVQDAFISGAINSASIQVVSGTPAALPDEPAVPNNCVVLASILVKANASSITNADITDLRSERSSGFACARGAIRQVATLTHVPDDLVDGESVYVRDTGSFLIHEQGELHPPWNLPWGRVAHASRDNSSAAITSTVDLANLSVQFTAVAGRRYSIRAKALFTVDTVGAEARLIIADGNDNQLQSGGIHPTSTTRSALGVLEVDEWVPGSGTVTVKLRALCQGGSATLIASSSSPSWIKVYDDGPAADPAS